MGKKRKSLEMNVEVEANMTPMIDMVFQLIIFFLLVLDFTQKDLEDLDPPSVRNGAVEDKPDPERLLINVTRNTEIVIKADTFFLPKPARLQLEKTKAGRGKITRLSNRVQKEGRTLEDLQTPQRLIQRIKDYGLEMERLDKRENLKPTDDEARIQNLPIPVPGGVNNVKVVDIPLLIRADRYTPFYAINDVLGLALPSADPLYMKKDPQDREPAFPFKRVEFSTKLEEEEMQRYYEAQKR